MYAPSPELSLPLTTVESYFRSAVDDLAVYPPGPDSMREVVRHAFRSLPDDYVLVLEITDPGFMERSSLFDDSEPDPNDLVYCAAIVDELTGDRVDQVWLDGVEVRINYDDDDDIVVPDTAITDFLARTGPLL